MEIKMDRYLSLKAFIQESLKNFNNRNKSGFAILHAIISVELALKERLHLINPHLIYQDIDSNKKITVALSKLPDRLKNLGVHLNEHDRKLIQDIANWRNDLVHNIPSHNPKVASTYLGKLYDFLFTFLSKELNKDITDIMSPSEISHMKDIIKEANALVQNAKNNALENNGQNHDYLCNDCHEKDVIGEKENVIFCFLCNEQKQEKLCQNCYKTLCSYSSIHTDGFFCDECVEQAGEEYISQQTDLSRGK